MVKFSLRLVDVPEFNVMKSLERKMEAMGALKNLGRNYIMSDYSIVYFLEYTSLNDFEDAINLHLSNLNFASKSGLNYSCISQSSNKFLISHMNYRNPRKKNFGKKSELLYKLQIISDIKDEFEFFLSKSSIVYFSTIGGDNIYRFFKKDFESRILPWCNDLILNRSLDFEYEFERQNFGRKYQLYKKSKL
ncbi:MAG: hypothetical protein KC589_04915 [Nanoarchaeota archaeon]|nr:hypothetical protein [Nanoarchaeota archaeon]